ERFITPSPNGGGMFANENTLALYPDYPLAAGPSPFTFTLDIALVRRTGDVGIWTVYDYDAGNDVMFRFARKSSTTAKRSCGEILATLSTPTDASRIGDLVVNVYNVASAQEAARFRGGSGAGSGALAGFLGATPVGRQSVGNAATDAATTQTLANN